MAVPQLADCQTAPDNSGPIANRPQDAVLHHKKSAH